MRTNAYCGICQTPVTRVFAANERPLLIERQPSTDGYIYVIDHTALGTIVEVVGTPDEVPGNVPLRYLPHVCNRVTDPKGGG